MMWLLVIAALTLLETASADPRQWANGGVATAVPAPILDFSSSTNAEGYTLVVWAQTRGAEPVVLGQLLAPDGGRLWEPDGRVLARGLERAGYPKVTAVETGWAIVWLDAEYIYWCDRLDGGWCISAALRAIKVDDTGAPVWPGGQNGVQVVPTRQWLELDVFQIFPSGGGAIVTWRNDYGDAIHALGISEIGQLWPEPVFMSGAVWSYRFEICSDTQGGVIAAWIPHQDTVVLVSKLSSTGEHLWGDTTGLPVHVTTDPVVTLRLCADGSGGAYVAWRDEPANLELMAQRVTSSGDLLWPGGTQLTVLAGVQEIIRISTSYSNGTPDGLLAIASDQNTSQMLGQKLSLVGERLWGNSGAVMCAQASFWSSNNVKLTSDQEGGLLCFYGRYIDDLQKYTAQRVAANGTLPWGTGCGVVVDSTALYDVLLSAPQVTGDDVRLVWQNAIDFLSNGAIQEQTVEIATGETMLPSPATIAHSLSTTAWNHKATKLENGSTAVVWETYIGSARTLFFQIMNVFGEPQLEPQGRPVCLDAQGNPLSSELGSLCPDGSGGFFVTFRAHNGTEESVRVTHLNGAGEFVGPAQGGLPYGSATSLGDDTPFCVADGAGGCFITTSEYDPNYMYEVYVARVNSQCQPVWDDPIVFSSASGVDQTTLGLVPSADNSCMVMFSRYLEWPLYALVASRITAEGEVLWENVVQDQVESPNYRFFVGSDLQNGAYFVWAEEDTEQGFNVLKAQHVSQTGARLWNSEGVEVHSSPQYPTEIVGGVDMVGNLTVAWGAFFGNSVNIWAQRLRPTGEVVWGADGLIVSATPRYKSNVQVAVISDNEVYVAWQDEGDGGVVYRTSDVYATHLNDRGEIGDDSYWVVDGSPICNYRYGQMNPRMVADGLGGAMIVWQDERTGTLGGYTSLYAQRLYDPIFTDAEEPVMLPQEFALAQNYPNPFNPETVIEFALPTASPVTLKVHDVTGRLAATLIAKPLTAGIHRVAFNAQELPSGVYFYTLRAANHTQTRKMVLLK